MAAFSNYGYSSGDPSVWYATTASTIYINGDGWQEPAPSKPSGPMQGEAVRWLEGRVNEMRATLH